MPRTTTAGQDTILAGDRDVHISLTVENGSGTAVDLSGRVRTWSYTQPNPDQPIATAEFEFTRGDGGTASLAPLIQGSTLNKLDDGTTYSPLLQVGREVVFKTDTVGRGDAASGSYEEVFRGTIDQVEWSERFGRAKIKCRDQAGVLEDTFIETERTYTAGTALETVIQNILNDNDAGGGYTAPTLYVPVATGATIPEITQAQVSVWRAITDLAASIGWVLWYKWDSGTSAFRLTLFEPSRSKSVADKTFGTTAYHDVEQLEIDVSNIRNVVEVVYIDSGTGAAASSKAEDATSIADYGAVRRYMKLIEGPESPIDSATEADALRDAALSDLKDPDMDQVIRLPYWWPGEVSDDLYTFSANDIHYSTDQTLAPFAISHSGGIGNVHETRIACRGKPSGGSGVWLYKGGLLNLDVVQDGSKYAKVKKGSLSDGEVDHGLLLGLGDDDHSQYVHLSVARTITAQHTIDGAWTFNSAPAFNSGFDFDPGAYTSGALLYISDGTAGTTLGLNPGTNGHVLTLVAGLPAWQAAPGSSFDDTPPADARFYQATGTLAGNHGWSVWALPDTSPAEGQFLVGSATAGVVEARILAASDIPNLDASKITGGTLVTSRGGTGVSAPTSGNLLVGAGTAAMTLLAPSTAGGFVRSNGTAWVRSTIQASDLPSHTHDASGINGGVALRVLYDNGTTGAWTTSPTTDGQVLTYDSGTSALVWETPSGTSLPAGVAGDFLRHNGTDWDDSAWGLPSGVGTSSQFLAGPASGSIAEWRILAASDIPTLAPSKISGGGTFGTGDYTFPGKVTANGLHPSAQFGSSEAVFLIGGDPHVGFNVYYDGVSWKIHTGTQGGNLIGCDPAASTLKFYTASSVASGNTTTLTERVAITAGTYSLDVTGSVRATGDFHDTSHRRWKDGIEDWPTDLEAFMALRPRTWVWNKEELAGKRGFGFVSDEVADFFASPDRESIIYNRMLTQTVGVVQSHEDRIRELEARVAELEEALNG